MKITPINDTILSSRTCRIDPALTPEQIEAKLPGCVNVFADGPSDDGKVDHYWSFKIGNVEYAVWSYYGARWSGFGPRDTFDELGLTVVGD